MPSESIHFNPDIRHLAIRQILKLGRQIEEEFGLRVRLGAEFECYAVCPPVDVHRIEPGFERAAHAAGMPLVHTLRQERGVIVDLEAEHHLWQQIETSVSYRDQNGAVSSPLAVAGTVDRLRDDLQRHPEDYGFTAIDARSVPDNADHGSALHLSVSVMPLSGEEPDKAWREEMNACLASGFMQAAPAVSLLFFPNEDALSRVGMSYAPSRYMVDNGAHKGHGHAFLNRQHRVENRLPGADADPYLAVLGTLACVYQGLRDPQPVPVRGTPVSRTQDELLTAFRAAPALVEDLLGREFCGAVERALDEARHRA